MPRQVLVATGSRLHFGLLSHSIHHGRRFGGIGIMISEPGVRILTSKSNSAGDDEYVGPCELEQRVIEIVSRFRNHFPQHPVVRESRLSINVQRMIPQHAGLGSGTQFGLAVALALFRLYSFAEPGLVELASVAKRGLRSALGLYGFQRGGLILEGGKRVSSEISPAICQIDFPSQWRFLLICPRNQRGISGEEEVNAFKTLPPMAQSVSAELCRISLLELLPAVMEQDFSTCSESLYRFGNIVGEYFAPIQGGVYASRPMERLVRELRDQGVTGIGQSSWGPTLWVLCPSHQTAETLCDSLKRSNWAECEFAIASPNNSGASVAVED